MSDTKTETHPKTRYQGVTFWPIPEVTDVEAIFGPKEGGYLTRYKLPEVPPKFEELAHDLFTNGQPTKDYGIEFPGHMDPEQMRRWVSSRLRSFRPAHEVKVATVAYALWLWSTPGACPRVPAQPMENI